MEHLSPDQVEWLAALPQGPLVEEGYMLAHGSPADEDCYLLANDDIDMTEKEFQQPLCFIGHTHFQRAWTWQGGDLYELPGPGQGRCEMIHELNPSCHYLVNPGSVGQPRDRDPRAAYAIWDSDRNELRLRRKEYDVAAAQRRIIEAGLPVFLADRLAIGH